MGSHIQLPTQIYSLPSPTIKRAILPLPLYMRAATKPIFGLTSVWLCVCYSRCLCYSSLSLQASIQADHGLEASLMDLTRQTLETRLGRSANLPNVVWIPLYAMDS